MSAKKCIAANCPFLGIIPKGQNKGKFICRTSQEVAGERNGVLNSVLIDDIIESGKIWNKNGRGEKIQPCSEWGSKKCSENRYKRVIRSLWRAAKSKRGF